MKINRNELDRVYNTKLPENNTSKKAKKETTEATDKIVLSDKAKEYSTMNSLTTSVVEEVTRKTSPEKLLKLKNDVAKGNYHVSSNDIAGAILGQNKNS